MDRASDYIEATKDLASYARALARPSWHFVRVVSLLSPLQRAQLLQNTYARARVFWNGQYTIDELITYVFLLLEVERQIEYCTPDPLVNDGDLTHVVSLLETLGPSACHTEATRALIHEHINALESEHDLDSAMRSSFDESIDTLLFDNSTLVAKLLAGHDHIALTRFVSRLLQPSASSTTRASSETSEIVPLWSQLLTPQVHTPELAAAIMADFRENRLAAEAVRNNARGLLSESVLVCGRAVEYDFNPEEEDVNLEPDQQLVWFDADDEHRDANNAVSIGMARGHLQHIVRLVDTKVAPIVQLQSDIQHRAAWSERYQFVDSCYGLLIPQRARISIATAFDRLVMEANRDKSVLLRMSPRDFEMFCGTLLSRLGFDVEITKATRDGGADLVCVRSVCGIPVRMAVELKRYKDGRPVDVSLIRSFVGANSQFKANKLVYITTSSYSGPALEYARRYEPHLLSLKGYEQLQEWCEDASKQEWKLH